MKKSKTKKILIIIFVSIFIIALGFFIPKIANKICYPYVKAKAVSYLCDKYDAEKSEFELVDSRDADFYLDSSRDELIQFLSWKDFAFEFKYKDRNFFVNRYEGKFYDDYQLEDIEKWCTEWLQNNVDENIIGIELDSIHLLDYYNYIGKKYNRTIKNEEIEGFLNNYSFATTSFSCVYFKENIYSDLTEEKLTDSLNEHLHLKDSIRAYYSKKKITRYNNKPIADDWYYYYSEEKMLSWNSIF